MLLPWQTGKVIRLKDESSGTRRFWIELESGLPFDFQPGQFVTLDLPIHEKPGKRWRSYSVASWPDGSPVFELVIVLLEQGAGTHYLFNEVVVGSVLTLRGPLGVFTLPEIIHKDLYFICTGTGIAPFRSMVHHVSLRKTPHLDIHLVFGCRRLGDALYRSEMESLERTLPGFYYHPVFSREPAGENVPNTGYVHGVYESLCRPRSGGNGLPPADFFLCGWKEMIDEARHRLQALGYEKKAVHFEIYG